MDDPLQQAYDKLKFAIPLTEDEGMELLVLLELALKKRMNDFHADLMDKDREYNRGYNAGWVAGAAARRTPLSKDEIFAIIEAESRRSGWTSPPTFQVARAIERAHGIKEE